MLSVVPEIASSPALKRSCSFTPSVVPIPSPTIQCRLSPIGVLHHRAASWLAPAAAQATVKLPQGVVQEEKRPVPTPTAPAPTAPTSSNGHIPLPVTLLENPAASASDWDILVNSRHAQECGLRPKIVHRNVSVAKYYEMALKLEKDSRLASTGALMANSYQRKGRSPKDKRVVQEPSTQDDVWWGGSSPNYPMEEKEFLVSRQRVVDYLNFVDQVFVVDAFANWDTRHRYKIRVVCTRPYHALFMHNMLIRPTEEELKDFGEPDFCIYNAGEFPANRKTAGMTSDASVALSLKHGELIILGTQYAGEMKKGVFTLMNYLMPKRGVLSLHSGANVGKDADVTLFFGLSGTGKTTLSADPKRPLIGDDEHCWSQEGVFNIEGGCYAKAISLKQEKEPEIWKAIKFGTVLENVSYDEGSRTVDYDSTALTENTRACYPIEYIDNARVPCVGGHPKNIMLLCCDAFGVLPPVSKLTMEQAMYYFVSGYTAKVAGTEMGVTEPEATFSACFGSVFLVWHPMKYAQMLAEQMQKHGATAWLINTGWVGGQYGVGSRISLKYTRAILDAIHSGELEKAPCVTSPVFGLQVPEVCTGVPSEVLIPERAWKDPQDFNKKLTKLGGMFAKNFECYSDGAHHVGPDMVRRMISGGPKVDAVGAGGMKRSASGPQV